MNLKTSMMTSSTTRPKLDRTLIHPIKEQREHETRAVHETRLAPVRKISTNLRPRISVVTRRERAFSLSSHDHEKFSSSSLENSHRHVKLENTYQLGPDVKFQVEKVTTIIKNVLERELSDMKYDPVTSAKTCISISNLMKEKVKMLNMKRYKIICNVIITERANQSMAVSSRFCWDKDTDNFASATFSSRSLHAVGMVYGVYLD